jgi:hypothetical protein
MARHDAGWWAERVAEFERTGDAERIARTHQVTVRLLKWWRWRLRSGAPKVAGSAASRAGKPSDEQRLLPVVVARDAEATDDDHEPGPSTIIETTRGRISIRGALSPEQLAAVVAELVRGC